MIDTAHDHRCLLGLVPAQHLPPHKTFKEIINTYQSIIQHTQFPTSQQYGKSTVPLATITTSQQTYATHPETPSVYLD